MRRKTAFNEGHFWENIGMFLFVVAGMIGLLYIMSTVMNW